jgi:uncharacterized protein with ParB-like and HNH nuclease domain
MANQNFSVLRAVEMINDNQIFLPALQRNFVWNRKRIEQYFDSLYKGFPLGHFIFWKLENGLATKYPLYQFVREYNERLQEKHPKPPKNLFNGREMWAVVDGQQRLSSLYIGLTGIYEYKRAGKGLKDIAHNFVVSRLYFNVFYKDENKVEDNGSEKIFSFKSEQEAEHINDKNLWIEAGRILSCRSEVELQNLMKELAAVVKKTNKKSIKQKYEERIQTTKHRITQLYKRLTHDTLSYFELIDKNIDEVIEIFVRVNSGGMQLKKADLLFSTIAAEWENARDKIDSLLESLGKFDLDVDRDFIMRTSLMLTDLPIKYKVETFNKRNIKAIIKNWHLIESALLRMAENLNQFGYKNFPNLSNNALIIIAYYISKGGDIKTREALTNIKLYYVTAQVKNLFGGQNDVVLSRIREVLRVRSGNEFVLKEQKFYFQTIRDLNLPIRKSFKIDQNYIETELADEPYGASAYFLLSLLYPALDFKMKRFELDHIHPRKKMNATHLRSLGLNDVDIEWILDHYDNLPNLELLTSEDNNSKKARPFIEFIREKKRNEKLRFLNENYISSDKDLWELDSFKKFYELRRKIIVKKLTKVFSS